MKKHLIFLLLLITSSTVFPWINNEGVPQAGWGGYRGLRNRLDDLKNGNPARDSYAQDAIYSCNLEDIKKYVKAPDFGRHPELLLKLIQCNCPEAWEYIDGLEDLDGAKLNLINTFIAFYDQLIEEGHEPASALQKLIATFGDDALPLFKQINSNLKPHDPQHQKLRKKLFNGLLPAAVEVGAHKILRESLENELYSDAIDVSIKNNDGLTISALIAAKKHFFCDEDEHMDSLLSVEEGRMRKNEGPHWETTYAIMQRKLRNKREKEAITNHHEKTALDDAEKQKEEAKLDQDLRENAEKVQALLNEQEQTQSQTQQDIEKINRAKEHDETYIRELLGIPNDDND